MADVIARSLRSHTLPTEWLGARVAAWFFAESGGLPWWATAITHDGKALEAAHTPGHRPSQRRIDYAHQVLRAVNREAAYGGAWLAAWVGPSTFVLTWKDRDGDIQLQHSCDKPWHLLREWPVATWIEKAHQMYGMWFELEEAKDARPDQSTKLAQGQRETETQRRVAQSGFDITVDSVLDDL